MSSNFKIFDRLHNYDFACFLTVIYCLNLLRRNCFFSKYAAIVNWYSSSVSFKEVPGNCF